MAANPNPNSNPFIQTWAAGIINGYPQGKPYSPEVNENEENFGNDVQQYYEYYNCLDEGLKVNVPGIEAKLQLSGNNYNLFTFPNNDIPLDKRLIGLTQIYIENTRLLPITNVFRNSDQGHDFYTDGRNVRGSFTYPTNANSIELSDYSRFTANTTFGGGSTVTALLLMYDETNDYLADHPGYNRIGITKGGTLDSNQIDYLVKTLSGKPLLKGTRHFNCTTDGIEYDVSQAPASGYVYSLLPLSMKGYDVGMHKLTDFEKPYKLYAVQRDSAGNYGGYLLYESKLKIPVISTDMILLQTNIIREYLATDPALKNALALKKKYDAADVSEKRSIEDKIYHHFKNFPVTLNPPGTAIASINRGVNYYFTNCKTTDEDMKFLLLIILRKLYNDLTPIVDENFKSLLEEKQTTISEKLMESGRAAGGSNPADFYKFTAFTTDTNTGPTETDIIKSYRDDTAVQLPYRFTIVSNAIDGSGQGGQIYPSYHPPDIDVYMNIFSQDNKYIGSVFRLTFLSNIISNSLNSKSNVFVQLHYCFIKYDDFEPPAAAAARLPALSGEDILGITALIKSQFKNILVNTKVENKGELLDITTVTKDGEKKWVFNKIDNAPSVELANKATVDPTFTNKVNKILVAMKITPKTNQKFSVVLSSLYNSLFSCICSQSVDIIEKFITAGLLLYYDNVDVLSPIFSDDPGSSGKSSPEHNFCKIFLLRNKFIGDKSRATDALFMNKNELYECVQSSNDNNTLSTAFMFNLSSQLLGAGSTNKSFYFAPYYNNKKNAELALAAPVFSVPSQQLGKASNRKSKSPTASGPAAAAAAAASGTGAGGPSTHFTDLQGKITSETGILANTKPPKNTAKKIDKNAYNAVISTVTTNRVRLKRIAYNVSRIRTGGAIPPTSQPSPLGVSQDQEEIYDDATQPAILPSEEIGDKGKGDSEHDKEDDKEDEEEEMNPYEPHAKVSDNSVIALQCNLQTISYIFDKYLKQPSISLTSDNIFIYMLLDRIEYLLENTSNIPLTIESFKIKLETYLQGEEKTKHYNEYFTCSFKTIFDMFSQAYMLDLYGVSFCYTTSLTCTPLVSSDVKVELEEGVPVKVEEHIQEEQPIQVEELPSGVGMGYKIPFENKNKNFNFDEDLSPLSNNTNDKYGAAGGGNIQVGGAVNLEVLSIIHDYYTNNYDDVLFRVTQFNEWIRNYILNVTDESLAANARAVDAGGEVSNILWIKLLAYINDTRSGKKADDRLLDDQLREEFKTFIQKNSEIIDMITDIKTFLDSVDYRLLVEGNPLSTYITFAFFIIKLCSDYRNYLIKLYSFYFRRLFDITDIRADQILQGVEENSTIDYGNLFSIATYNSAGASSMGGGGGGGGGSEEEEETSVTINVYESLTPDERVFILSIYEFISFVPDGIAQSSKINVRQTYSGVKTVVKIPTDKYRPQRTKPSYFVSLKFLDVNMIIDKLVNASCRVEYYEQTYVEVEDEEEEVDEEAPKVVKEDGLLINSLEANESERPAEVTRRTKIYLQQMMSAILFLINHSYETNLSEEEEARNNTLLTEINYTPDNKRKRAKVILKSLSAIKEKEEEEEKEEQAPDNGPKQFFVVSKCQIDTHENFMLFLIKNFFLNVTQGSSVDNYYGSSITSYNFTGNAENFTITITTAADSSRLTCKKEEDESYSVIYDILLLKQLLMFIYDKCLFYLIITNDQYENLFSKYIGRISADGRSQQVSVEAEGGDLSILFEISDTVNTYFKDKRILTRMRDIPALNAIPAGINNISSVELDKPGSDQLAPLIDGSATRDEILVLMRGPAAAEQAVFPPPPPEEEGGSKNSIKKSTKTRKHIKKRFHKNTKRNNKKKHASRKRQVREKRSKKTQKLIEL